MVTIADHSPNPIVLLGAGYTGTFLYTLARQQERLIWASSRQPHENLPFAIPSHRIEFDLARPDTWGNIPDGISLIWCFPAVPTDMVIRFMKQTAPQVRRLLVLGSTSAYASTHAQARLVDETTEVNLTLPRVQSEEFLRQTYGAVILRLAGLYGPGRNVLDWIRRGRITNTDRYVNLIHIEDVAGICLAALERSQDGETYIVSDGIPRRWSDICDTAASRWGIPTPPVSRPKDPGKRLSTKKLQTELHYELQHPDLYEALEHIERERTQCIG